MTEGQTVTVSGELTYDSDGDGTCDTPLANKTVKILLTRGDTILASTTATTDSGGNYSATLTIPNTEYTTHIIAVAFEGDGDYSPCGAETDITVYSSTAFRDVSAPSTIYVNDTATVSAHLQYYDPSSSTWNDLAWVKIEIKWTNPSGTTVRDVYRVTGSDGWCSDSYTVDQAGTWKVSFSFPGTL